MCVLTSYLAGRLLLPVCAYQMATMTERLMLVAQGDEEAGTSGRSEYVQYRLEQYYDKHHNFALLDNMFEAFVNTNVYREQNYTLANLIDTPFDKKRYFKFFSDKIPYLATVFTVDLFKGPQLTIKLPNVGFVYKPKDGVLVPPRHKSDDWVMLAHFERCFPKLMAAATLYGSAVFMYSNKTNRVDLILEPHQQDLPSLCVTYEPGSPYYDDTPSWRKPIVR